MIQLDVVEDATGRAERFEVRGRLGAGGVGEVHRVFDQRLGREVALKVLRSLSAPALYRFKREFRALADIVHPNLITLHELHTSSDEWFFTMELVEGVSFLDWVRPRAYRSGEDGNADAPASRPRANGSGSSASAPTSRVSGAPPHSPTEPDTETCEVPARLKRRDELAAATLDEPRLRAALAQLVDAVLALHTDGKLHRDLKPSNVLVTGAGRVVVLDFGLIAEVDARLVDRTHEASAVGTPMYMSPEQAADRPLTEATDWYSVGVMLFEALTGRRPFEGSPDQVLARKQHESPPRAQALVPSVPADLDALCAGLLARDPAQRPEGRAILAALGVAASRATVELGRMASTGPFVGRTAELAALERARGDARTRGVTIFVGGDSGMGKSQLVRRFLDDARAGDALVLEGRCYQREAVPFKTLDTVIDALTAVLVRLPEAQLTPVIPRDIAALARLFPVLRRIPALNDRCVGALCPPDPQELRRRGFSALRHLLRSLTWLYPLVIWIDDLQWGDADSAVFLADLVHAPEPLLLLFTHRHEDDAGVVDMIRQGPAIGGSGGNLRMLEIGPLADPDARALVTGIAGPDIDTDAVVREAGGHPLYLAEMARSHGEAAGRSLASLLEARIAALPAGAAALLRACAIEARPLLIEHAVRAAGLDALGAELGVLRAEHLIRVRRLDDDDLGHLEPYHDRVRAAAVAGLTAAERRAVHRALAETFEAQLPDDRLLDSLVGHWLAAGEPARAAVLAVEAARFAEEALAFRRAADLYALALLHGGHDDATRGPLLRRRGDALANAGQLDAAGQAYLAATVGATPAARIELERLHLEQLLRGGRFQEGLALSRDLLARHAYALPASRRAAVRRVIRQRIGLRLRGLTPRARPLASVAAAELQRADALFSVSNGLTFVDPLMGRVVQNDYLRAALDVGDPFRLCKALCQEMGYLGQIGGKARGRAEALSAQLRALGAEVQHAYITGLTASVTALYAYLTGRWRDARDQFEHGLKVMRDHGAGVRWELDMGELFLMSSLCYLGETAELVRMVPILLREAVERGDVYAQHGLRSWRPNVRWLVAGAPAEARAHLIAVEAERPAQPDFHVHDYYMLVGHTQIDLYLGDAEGAWRRVEAARRPMARSHIDRVQAIRVEMAYLRARTALAMAARAGNPERAHRLGEIRSHARALRREGVGWAASLAALVEAGAAMISGDRGAADALTAAVTALEAVDMRLHASVVRLRQAEHAGDAAAAAAVRAVMRERAVADPDAIAALLMPGPC